MPPLFILLILAMAKSDRKILAPVAPGMIIMAIALRIFTLN